MPMEVYEMSPLAKRAEALLEQALSEVRDGLDALPTIGLADATLRVEAGELSADEIDI